MLNPHIFLLIVFPHFLLIINYLCDQEKAKTGHPLVIFRGQFPYVPGSR